MTVQRRAKTAEHEGQKKAQDGRSRQPHLSVILCTYNRRSLVLATLASLRHQTFPGQDFEVIVVDNGSQDHTIRAIYAYIEAKEAEQRGSGTIWNVQCLSEPRCGLVHARNTGLLAAKGEIAVFVDDDTLIDPHMLERLWQAYQETGADAIGMRVKMHWDITPPHWMLSELLDILGQFAPQSIRAELAPNASFASCAFSVKMSVLREINYFSRFLSKRANIPASTEMANLCWRLQQAGYALWYEPQALVWHRITSARLQRAFFVGRGYWLGRSEIIQHLRRIGAEDDKVIWDEVIDELIDYARCLFLQTPLIHLAGRPTSERLLAAVEQAQCWGRLVQLLIYLEHIPPELETPAVFLVQGSMPDASFNLMTDALEKQEVRYLIGRPEIPLGWLWRHRMYRNQPVGILHFYQPGTLELTRQQSQRLLFRLWLARRLGIRIVVTDNGGWWQSTRGSRFRARRAFERKLLHASHAVISSTSQPGQLYRDRSLLQRVRSIVQPGFRGYYPPASERSEARNRLGLMAEASFVYLCLAHLHIEREILFLVEAFRLLTLGSRHRESLPGVQLLIVGQPIDCANSVRITRRAASDSQVKLYPTSFREVDLPLYMGACNAQVFPHQAVHTAGQSESVSLALSYSLLVVAPDLPRFRGVLPQRVSLPYVPGSRESLAEALIKAQQVPFSLQEQERENLDAEQGWQKYTHDLLAVYHELLGPRLS